MCSSVLGTLTPQETGRPEVLLLYSVGGAAVCTLPRCLAGLRARLPALACVAVFFSFDVGVLSLKRI